MVLVSTSLKNIAQQSRPDDFLEFRFMIEAQTAASAANKATKKDIENLEDFQRLLTLAKEDNDLYLMLSIDVKFHKSIAETTHNPLIIGFYGCSFRRLGN